MTSPAPADLPAWFAVAAAGGHDVATADSLAAALPADAGTRKMWMSDSAAWGSRLVVPFIERMRSNLALPLAPDPPVRVRLARILAARTAFTRWGPEGEEEFVLHHDADIRIALGLFERLKELLPSGGPP